MSSYSADWAKVDVDKVPNIKVTPPGPKSKAIQKRADKYMQGYSSQVSLFKVAFESGHDHLYERSRKGDMYSVTAGGAGALLYGPAGTGPE